MGYPLCGNLRSTKRAEVKQRIQCIKALLADADKVEENLNYNDINTYEVQKK